MDQSQRRKYNHKRSKQVINQPKFAEISDEHLRRAAKGAHHLVS
jgi:hypothetical protein